MKGNNGTGNTVERDVWETPQELWDSLNKQYKFEFDCCASKNNAKCRVHSSKFEDITLKEIDDHIELKELFTYNSWMNPPFSIAERMFTHFFKIVNKGVAIYRCDNMETKLWQDIIFKNATWVLIPKGRWSYEGFEGIGSRFASALIGFNVDIPKYVKGDYTILKCVVSNRG